MKEDIESRVLFIRKLKDYLAGQVEIAVKRVAVMDLSKTKHSSANAFSIRIGSDGELKCAFRCDCPLKKKSKEDPNFDTEITTVSKKSLRSGGLKSDEWASLVAKCASHLEFYGKFPKRVLI